MLPTIAVKMKTTRSDDNVRLSKGDLQEQHMPDSIFDP
jgi:hypothetical protein